MAWRHAKNVAGHVPRAEPAGAACAGGPRAGARRRRRDWWAPGDGKPLAALAPYRRRFRQRRRAERRGARRSPTAIRSSNPSARTGAPASPVISRRMAMSLSVEMIRRRWDETEGKDRVVRAGGRHGLPASSAGGSAVPLTAAGARPVPDFSAVAAEGGGWLDDRSGVHARSRARSRRAATRTRSMD